MYSRRRKKCELCDFAWKSLAWFGLAAACAVIGLAAFGGF